MARSDEALKRDARRAYERGRMRAAVRATWPIVPMAIIVHPACSTPAFTVSAAAVLAVLSAVLGWRGEAYGKAVYPGLLAGFFAAIVPMLARVIGLCGDS